MGRDRDESGRYTGNTDADVLAAVRAHEPAATSEVGDELGISRQAADLRLRKLRDEGRVNSKKIGASLVWFAADDTPDATTDESAPDRRESDPAPERDRSPTDEPGTAHDDHADAEVIVDDVAAGWDRDERLEDRKAAAVAVLEYAVDADEHVGRSTAVERFHDEYPVDGQNAETWYRQNVRPVLQAVGDYSRGHHGYRVDRDRVAEVAQETTE